MNIRQLDNNLRQFLPYESAISGDNIGVQVEAGEDEIEVILVCHEVTDAVVHEAVTNGANAIVAYHPLIYNPLSKISSSDRVSRIVRSLIQNHISLICVHTSLDVLEDGTSTLFARKLNLCDFEPVIQDANQQFGMGVVGRCPAPTTTADFIQEISSVTGQPCRFYDSGRTISRVAIVAGSGIEYFDAAVGTGADAFVTADVKYHAFHRAYNLITLIDPGHFEMESFVTDALTKIVAGCTNDRNALVIPSVTTTNPIQYSGTPNLNTKTFTL